MSAPGVKATCYSLTRTAGCIPSSCHHILPVVTLYVSRNKPGKKPETQHPLPRGDSLWPSIQSPQNKPTRQRKNWNVCSDSYLGLYISFGGSCDVCWMVYVWACRMHYGAVRRMCTAHFPLQAPRTPLRIQYNQTVTLTWYIVCKIGGSVTYSLKYGRKNRSSWQVI